MTPTTHSIADVAALTDTPVRTIRYYVAQGLLPSTGKTGPAARYDDAFVARLRAIRMLQEAHQPLSVIRATLDQLDDHEIRAIAERPVEAPPGSASEYVRRLLGERTTSAAEQLATYPSASPPAPAAHPWTSSVTAPRALMASLDVASLDREPPTEPAQRDRSHWERIVLAPGVELHIRRPQSRWSTRQVERLVEFGSQLFRKGAP
jgi:DNA-binding transcriptional MerR regulator